MDKAEQNSSLIKAWAAALGFQDCGISKARFLEEEASRLEKWLNENRFGTMEYMQRNFDKRLDPTLLVDKAKSVISLSYNYYPTQHQNPNSFKIAKYAYGEDYHEVVKEKLLELVAKMQENIGRINARVFTDSAPILEKAWASKSGIGWQGKNGNLISKQKGSFFFLAEIILDIPLAYDTSGTSHCGTCTKCIDACPTQAIYEPYKVDGSKCISYFTIELKDEIPAAQSLEDWMFGCDICQNVCPWNRFSKPHQEAKFEPHAKLLAYTKKDWQEITVEIFQEIFKKSAVKRTKYAGLQRNIAYLAKK